MSNGVTGPTVALGYCARGLAVQAPVPHVQFASPFATPIFTGLTSQHSARGPLPS